MTLTQKLSGHMTGCKEEASSDDIMLMVQSESVRWRM